MPLFSLPADVVETELNHRLLSFQESAESESCFVFAYEYCAYYLADETILSLLACIRLVRETSSDSKSSIRIYAGVIESSPQALAALSELDGDSDDACGNNCCESVLAEFIASFGGAWLDLDAPLTLKPINITKPWGQEVWYTGIEARGQSLVEGVSVSGSKGVSPLPWVLSLAPQRFVGGLDRQLCLLKVLDPLPDEVYGDLYFEMHERKREVYIVTHVDAGAWPDGCGAIRFGFDQNRRAELGDKAFKLAYYRAVKDYELVRREIDAIFDRRRTEQGIGLESPVGADTLKSWHQSLPQPLQAQELKLRSSMESFTSMKPLRLGDVVKVPCFTPHSLQHGVRTVEFQTPVYERKILSFAQKVLTQASWDTERALELMSLQAPADEPLPILQDEEGCRVEQVVRFDDFEVLRICLSVESSLDLRSLLLGAAVLPYVLVMPVCGSVVLAGNVLPESRAWLLGKSQLEASNLVCSTSPVEGIGETVFLLARPL